MVYNYQFDNTRHFLVRSVFDTQEQIIASSWIYPDRIIGGCRRYRDFVVDPGEFDDGCDPALLTDDDQNLDVIPAVDVNPALASNSQGQIVVVWERTVESRTNLVMRVTQASKITDWSLLQ